MCGVLAPAVRMSLRDMSGQLIEWRSDLHHFSSVGASPSGHVDLSFHNAVVFDLNDAAKLRNFFRLDCGCCVLLRIVVYCCFARSPPAGSLGCPFHSNRGISTLQSRNFDSSRPALFVGAGTCYLSPFPTGTGGGLRRKIVTCCFHCFSARSANFPRSRPSAAPVPIQCRKLRRTLAPRTRLDVAANRPMAAKCHFFGFPTCQYSASG